MRLIRFLLRVIKFGWQALKYKPHQYMIKTYICIILMMLSILTLMWFAINDYPFKACILPAFSAVFFFVLLFFFFSRWGKYDEDDDWRNLLCDKCFRIYKKEKGKYKHEL